MKLSVQRSGGLAGLRMPAVEVDTASLAASAEVDAAVDALTWDAPSGPPNPDGFTYAITQLDHPQQRTAIVNERDVSPALRPLIDAARPGGH
jgi:hypothetical protein